MVRPIYDQDFRDELNSDEPVFVRCYSSATVQDMKHAVPTKNRNPSLIILHAGTNNLSSNSNATTFSNLPNK